MFPAENKVESLPAAPSRSCSGPFFVFFQCLFFLYLAWPVSSFIFEESRSPGLPIIPSALGWLAQPLARVPAAWAGTGFKLLKVYTQAVLIFTYK